MNTFGVLHVWAEGDFVTRAVAIVLLAMSLLSWTIIIVKLWQQSQLRRMAAVGGKEFWRSRSIVEGVNMLGPDREANPFRALTEDGISAVQHHSQKRGELQAVLDASEWLHSALRATQEEITNHLQRGETCVS